ncbi:MAG: RsmE family RNA methyltransferase, partial [Nitrospinota bacterium]
GERARPIRGVLAAGGHSAALLVGPEGGLTAGEVEEARRAGFLPVGPGPRTLRAETAALALITIVQHRLGDMG